MLPAGISLSVTPKAVDTVVEGSAQVQQLFNIECITDFSEAPLLNVSFTHGGQPQHLSLKLPVMVSKFLEAADMDAEAFFTR